MKKKDYNNSLPPGFGMGVGRGQRRLATLLSPEGAVQCSARLFSPSAVWSHGQGPTEVSGGEARLSAMQVIYLPCPQPPLLQPSWFYFKLT